MDQHFLNFALSLPNPGTVLITLLGIGLVIFVHEAGHFMCARLCGVDVEVFSLGFGPRLFGFVRGGTDYRVSLVPIGGYVKMLGDQPGEGEGNPRALGSKSVGQRFLVYSGGVIMNVVFALIVFPVIFAIGVPLPRPAVGTVAPGSAAWKAGLVEGDEIVTINERRILGFMDISLEIALTDVDDTTVRLRRAGEERVLRVRPEYSEDLGVLALGIGQPIKYDIDVAADGAAARAGLASGDVLLEIDGYPASARSMRRLETPVKDPIPVVVQRGGERVAVDLHPDFKEIPGARLLGIRAPENLVVGLRGRFAAGGSPLREDDVLLSIGGRTVFDVRDVEDAIRDGVLGALDPVPITVERSGETLELALARPLAEHLADDVALAARPAEEEVPAVPLIVSRGSAAEAAGLVNGMRLVLVDGREVHRWQDVRDLVEDADGDEVAVVALDHDGARREFRVKPTPMVAADYGIALDPDMVVRRYGLGEAFQVGMFASWNLARQVYLTLRKMVSQQVAAKNLGGPVAITAVSYHFAKSGLSRFFYFLALLSINLAVVNVLPIPILDGGHLLFLLIEKVKGSPVDDRIMGYSQVFGLMVILSLLIFVTYNDIARLFE